VRSDDAVGVVSSLHSMSGRAMLTALIAGERAPTTPAEMAGGPMRRKIPQLRRREIIAEIGLDHDCIRTAGHLLSWAKFAPLDQQSTGRRRFVCYQRSQCTTSSKGRRSGLTSGRSGRSAG
jgi:hypothetical protein